jgi:hypothetical protein
MDVMEITDGLGERGWGGETRTVDGEEEDSATAA